MLNIGNLSSNRHLIVDHFQVSKEKMGNLKPQVLCINNMNQ